MDIKLSHKHAAFIRARMASGKYSEEADVIREALDALAAKKKAEARCLVWLKAEVQKGIDDVEAGRVHDLDIEEIIATGRARNRKKQAA